MKLYLRKSQFSLTETLLLETEHCKISTFCYASGVEAIRLIIGRGEYIWLPFFGQSLWSWKVDHIEQKFQGFVSEPDYAAINFLHNYGAFMVHCGITAMGNPSKDDTHLHHGELPLARYTDAWIELSEGSYPVELCGRYRYAVPYLASYEFSPSLKISQDGTSLLVDSKLENLQNTTLDYMYLNHVNFSLEQVDELHYGVEEFSDKSVTVLHETIPHAKEDPHAFLHPSKIAEMNPEFVAIIKNQPSYGKVSVNTMKRHDKKKIWVAINTTTLDHTVVWMTKTLDRSACGFSLPSTAGPRGLLAETTHGNIKKLEPKESIRLQFACGIDDETRTESLHKAITMLGGVV